MSDQPVPHYPVIEGNIDMARGTAQHTKLLQRPVPLLCRSNVTRKQPEKGSPSPSTQSVPALGTGLDAQNWTFDTCCLGPEGAVCTRGDTRRKRGARSVRIPVGRRS